MCCDKFWDDVREKADRAADVIKAIIANPLPVIETIALTMIGVPPPIANAAVTALNGGSVEDIAKAAVVSYVAPEISKSVSGTVASVLPEGTNAAIVKAASSAVGADAAATVVALASGKSLEDSLKVGTTAAINNLAVSAGTAAGQEVASNIEDPTLSKIAGAATKAGTTATLAGKDGAAAALTAGEKEAAGPLLDQFGNVISDIASNLPSGPSVDFSGLKEAIKPISDVATSIAEPIYQKASDVATAVAEPISKVATSVAEPVGKAISTAADTVKGALPSEGVKISGDNLDKSIIDLMAKAPGDTNSGSTSGTTVAGGPAVSDVASGAAASPAAFGGADVAMLGDTSPEGMGSKVSKKGGKYPWGEPEGTTALKEGLGIG